MKDDSYFLCYLVDDISETVVKEAVERCRSIGFKVENSNSKESSENIYLSHDNITQLKVAFNFGDGSVWNDPKIVVSFSAMPLYTSDDTANQQEHTRERVQERANAIIDLTRALVTLSNPAYGWGMLAVGPNHTDGLLPTARPISENISRLSWITVFSPSIINELGGRERVLDTPAWKVEELETGHIMIIRSDNPVDPTVTPDASPEKYLFGGKDLAERHAERGLSDPFERFEPGDFGADIVMGTDDISTEPANENLSLARCRVDDDHMLREIESGAFVRRIIGEGGTPIGEVPADVDPTDERVSVVMHPNVPESFVRLEGPADENVITRLMGLDVDVNKFQLFVNLVSMAQDSEFDETDVQTIENTLAQLGELDDVDGVERLIEQRLL